MDFFDLIRWYRVKWCRFWSRYSSEKQIKVIRFWASTDRARNVGLTSMLTNTLPDYVRAGNRDPWPKLPHQLLTTLRIREWNSLSLVCGV